MADTEAEDATRIKEIRNMLDPTKVRKVKKQHTRTHTRAHTHFYNRARTRTHSVTKFLILGSSRVLRKEMTPCISWTVVEMRVSMNKINTPSCLTVGGHCQ